MASTKAPSLTMMAALGSGWLIAAYLWMKSNKTSATGNDDHRDMTLSATSTSTKKVYLVGAGPGGVGLITVRGLELLQAADVIISDELADPELLLKTKENATVIVVGKRGGKADSVAQPEINKILVSNAAVGRVVVRLKGGDPLVFGRLQPEMSALSDAGIEWEIVPGVTSVLAAAAAAGIPVTEKNLSKSFVTLSGHAPDNIDWGSIADIDTILILMGTRKIDVIFDKLLEVKDAQTPIAVVQWAYTPKERIIAGQLGLHGPALKQLALSPAIIIIGRVAVNALSHPLAEVLPT